MFWQTQGSGKSLAMVFFAQKVLRRVPGNWTFVVVTDREEIRARAVIAREVEDEATLRHGEAVRRRAKTGEPLCKRHFRHRDSEEKGQKQKSSAHC